MMKKYLTLMGIMALISVFYFGQNSASANPGVLTITTLNGNANIATTSTQFMTTGTATTTMIIPTTGSDQVDINMLLTASSSATLLNYQVSFSNNLGCDSASVTPRTNGLTNGGIAYVGNCDFFTEDTNTVSGSYVTESSTTIHQWQPLQTASTSLKSITETNIAARFTRVDFWLTGASGALWSQGVVKTQRP